MKKKEKLIKITCTEEQAWLIETALDTLSRMACGQLNTIVDGIEDMIGIMYVNPSHNKTLEKISDGLSFLEFNKGKMSGYRLGSHVQNLIKPLLFPKLHPNESYGIGNKKIGKAQIAYEMVKKLQNFRVRSSKSDYNVLKYEHLHYSNQPLIQIEEVKSEKQNKKK